MHFYTQQKMTMTRWFESHKDSHADPIWKTKRGRRLSESSLADQRCAMRVVVVSQIRCLRQQFIHHNRHNEHDVQASKLSRNSASPVTV